MTGFRRFRSPNNEIFTNWYREVNEKYRKKIWHCKSKLTEYIKCMITWKAT